MFLGFQFSLHHVGLDIVKFFSEVTVTFNIGRQVSNIKTPRNLMNVNWFPERKKSFGTISKQILL